MKAIVQSDYGEAEQVLKLKDVDTPRPADREVLVRVRAASVHPDVWHAVTGLPYMLRIMGGIGRPKNPIPGTDLAGVVDAVGKDVTRFKAGDEVFGDVLSPLFGNGGTFAEYTTISEDSLALKPPNVTFEQAGSIPTSGFLAMYIQGRLKPGQRALINGAGGCVGSIALQIAKAEGAHVTVVDRGSRLEMLRDLGADATFDFTREDITQSGQRFDFILDIASNLTVQDWKRIVAPDGIYVLLGHAHFGKKGGRVFGIIPQFFGTLARAPFDKNLPSLIQKIPRKQDVMERFRSLMESGKLTPSIARAFPLSETVQAIRALTEEGLAGRIVVVP